MVPIDHFHVLTIDTKPDNVRPAVQAMIDTIRLDLDEREHHVSSRQFDRQVICFENPEPGYWHTRTQKRRHKLAPFLVTVCDVHNRKLETDHNWQQITSLDNLELAWARARSHISSESFYDEVEIRLFEGRLPSNLERLQAELKSYAIHAGYVEDTLPYHTPKKPGRGRPRGLTWLEEEILMVAIIQVIGRAWLAQRGVSFAYRLSGENTPERGKTEYLYQRWTEAWKDFREAIQDEIRKRLPEHPDARVFQTDISAFFERIVQDSLAEMN